MNKKKILVVDDEEILTRTFSRLLDRVGYEVLVVSRTSDAIVMCEEEDFDLIISDIRMPGMDGVQMMDEIQKVRREKMKNAIPIIFLTGYADKDQEVRAKALRPLAYILKPFDVTSLLKTIGEKIT